MSGRIKTTPENAALLFAAKSLQIAVKLTLDSLKIRSFQKGGVSYGGDHWTISQEAVDALRQSYAESTGGQP